MSTPLLSAKEPRMTTSSNGLPVSCRRCTAKSDHAKALVPFLTLSQVVVMDPTVQSLVIGSASRARIG